MQQVYNPCHALEVKKVNLVANLQKHGGIFDILYLPPGLWHLQDYQNFLDDPLNNEIYHKMVQDVMAFPYANKDGTHLFHADEGSTAVENMVDYGGKIPTYATYPFIPCMQYASYVFRSRKCQYQKQNYTPDKANGTIFGVRSLVNLYAGYHGIPIGAAIKCSNRRKLTEYWLQFHNVDRYGQPGVSPFLRAVSGGAHNLTDWAVEQHAGLARAGREEREIEDIYSR